MERLLRDMTDKEARETAHEWVDFLLDRYLPGRRTCLFDHLLDHLSDRLFD
ncbi:hypothetical protein [Bacteroides rodentium]|jgi:hypothetical protein|uniref:hypothetical protein n=1 Tax=Bacteroides rodentium TaxID=691816 RepID=UPI000AEF8E4E|nr:hypothetical protein [Bacteroides rodentium]